MERTEKTLKDFEKIVDEMEKETAVVDETQGNPIGHVPTLLERVVERRDTLKARWERYELAAKLVEAHPEVGEALRLLEELFREEMIEKMQTQEQVGGQ